MIWSENDIYNMRIAIDLAYDNLANDEVPVGVVIVRDGTVIAKSNNSMILRKNSISHAEINAINLALAEVEGNFLIGCDIYITLEPCPMCAYAISLARIARVFIATPDHKFGAYSKLNLHNKSSKYTNHTPIIYFGLLERESMDMIYNFFKGKR